MNQEISRRHLLKSAIAAPAAIAFSRVGTDTAFAVDFAKPVPESKGLTAYQNGTNVLLRLDNLPVLGYRAHPTLKYPYFCPLNAKREAIFFYAVDEPSGEYHDFEVFNSARSLAENVFQNNVIFQSNGEDFSHLFKLTKGYQRRSDLGDNTFLANHWSDENHLFGDDTPSGDPRLTGDYEPAAALIVQSLSCARIDPIRRVR